MDEFELYIINRYPMLNIAYLTTIEYNPITKCIDYQYQSKICRTPHDISDSEPLANIPLDIQESLKSIL